MNFVNGGNEGMDEGPNTNLNSLVSESSPPPNGIPVPTINVNQKPLDEQMMEVETEASNRKAQKVKRRESPPIIYQNQANLIQNQI